MCFVFDVDDEVEVICEEDYTDVILDVLHKYPSITKCNAAKHNYSTKLSNSEKRVKLYTYLVYQVIWKL